MGKRGGKVTCKKCARESLTEHVPGELKEDRPDMEKGGALFCVGLHTFRTRENM